MNKVNVLYKIRKEEIFGFYSNFNKINVDNIEDVNDHIIDVDLKKEQFDHPLEEFFNTVSMCMYMIENDLYDEYFFTAYKEILEDYNNHEFDDAFISEEDKKYLDSDIEELNDYLKKEETMGEYYNTLSNVMDKEVNNNERE